MREFQPKPILIVFVACYFIMLVVVGLLEKKKAKTKEEFLLAGRGLGPFVLMGTFLATYVGNGTIAGGGNSLAFTFGLWPGIFFAVPGVLTVIILYYLSDRVRKAHCFTMAELISKKYGETAYMISACLIILAQVSILAYQYKGLAYVLKITVGLNDKIGMIVSAILIIFLAYSGGLRSVALTDAISAFMMLIGIVLATPFVINVAGGNWAGVLAHAQATDPQSLTLTGGQTFYGFLAAYFPLFFLTLGDQNMYQRMMAGKSDKSTRIGFIGWLLGIVVVIPLVAVIAFCAKQIFGDNIKAGMAFMSTTTVIPTVIGGLLLAAATAFIVTTGDSYILSGSSNIAYDLYEGHFNKNATDAQVLKVARNSILVVGIFAYIMMQFFPSILAIQYWSYTISGAGVTIPLLAALCWSKANRYGGIASMIVGAAVTIIWEILGHPYGIATVLVAIPASFLAMVIGSLTTQGLEKGVNIYADNKDKQEK